jgi:hypothetical protein
MFGFRFTPRRLKFEVPAPYPSLRLNRCVSVVVKEPQT